MTPATDQYQEIRDAVRDLCAQLPDEYHRKIDENRGYPGEFVHALTKADWLAALIPQDYGGSGACHGQMYNLGTLLRHGSDEQKKHS